MKYLLTVSLLICSSLFAREVCDDKNKNTENGHIHYIYPSSISESATLVNKRFDLTHLRKKAKTKVKLKLVGFDTYPGGLKVKKDLDIAKSRLTGILNSEVFKANIFEHKYGRSKRFKYRRKKTNAEIYKIILDGADKYNTEVDNEIDMILCPYISSKKVIGYTYSSRKEVWVNFKYYRDRYNKFQISDMVGNILHEWIHNASFGHSSKNNKTRKYTVPYGVGYIARDIARVLDEPTL